MLTWNLFHGRAQPPARRSLLDEFCAALDGWEWDVAMLQEVPPWWPPLLARATGATGMHMRLTSRNSLLPLRKAIASRNPDLIKSHGGGCNAILLREARVAEARERRLRWFPERRWALGVLADPWDVWIVNLHGCQWQRAEGDVRRALAAAEEWSGGMPLIFGGDLNLTGARSVVAPLRLVASRHVDHIAVRGFQAAGKVEMLHKGDLSDHRPFVIEIAAE